MELPEITEVKRLTFRPGDRLVVRLDRTPDMAQTRDIEDLMREFAGQDVPVLVLGPEVDIEVISADPEAFAKYLRSYVRVNGGWARLLGGGI